MNEQLYIFMAGMASAFCLVIMFRILKIKRK